MIHTRSQTPQTDLLATTSDAGHDPGGWTLHVVDDLAGIRALQDDWECLLPANAAPFLRFGWISGWYEAYEVEPCVIVLENAGKVASILPGYLEDRRFRLAGDVCCDYQDLIVDPADTIAIRVGLKLAMNWLRDNRQATHFYFEKLSSEGVLHSALTGEKSEIENTLVCGKNYAPCPRVALRGGLEGYFGALPGKVRQDLRRSLRRLDKALPQVRHQIDRAPNESTLIEAAAFHVRHFRKSGVSPLSDPRQVSLLVAAAQDRSIGIQLSTMEYGDEMLALDIGFVPPGTATYYGYLTAFHPNYQKLAPGKCLMLRRIDDWVSKDGVEWLDFLAGDEGYKQGLTQGEGYEVRSVHWMPRGLVDRVRQLSLTLEKRGRRLARKGLEKSGFLNR